MQIGLLLCHFSFMLVGLHCPVLVGGMLRYHFLWFWRFVNVVVLMHLTVVGMFVSVLKSHMPTTGVMDMFTTVTVVMLVYFMLRFLGMVNMRCSFMVVEMAAICVMDMVLIDMPLCLFMPNVATPWVVYVFVLVVMIVIMFFVPVIDMLFGFAVVQVAAALAMYR